MIIGDIETTEKVEYEDLLKNYYEKMEIIEEQDKEIERLNNIINKAIELIREYKQCLEQGNNKNADYIYISSLCNKLEMLEQILGSDKVE